MYGCALQCLICTQCKIVFFLWLRCWSSFSFFQRRPWAISALWDENWPQRRVIIEWPAVSKSGRLDQQLWEQIFIQWSSSYHKWRSVMSPSKLAVHGQRDCVQIDGAQVPPGWWLYSCGRLRAWRSRTTGASPLHTNIALQWRSTKALELVNISCINTFVLVSQESRQDTVLETKNSSV